MFSSSKTHSTNASDHDNQLTLSGSGPGSLISIGRSSGGANKSSSGQDLDETTEFLLNKKGEFSNRRKAKLAKEETIDPEEEEGKQTCFRMLFHFLKRKRIFIPLIIISFIAAIYCIPYIEIEPRIPAALPHIPFNFRDGPLKASSASQFKVDRLFYGQIHGPESVALDSMGNMYMAIEGGFIMYAHLNKSSPFKSSYFNNDTFAKLTQAYDYGVQANQLSTNPSIEQYPDLVKIAELNGIKQIPYENGRRQARMGGSWRRECQLDEKVYGSNLAILTDENMPMVASNEIDSGNTYSNKNPSKKFVSNVVVSRCSKPLGVRLSPDESYLYVIDTLSGLYRISLKVSEKPHSTQRLVTKLIDFKAKRNRLLPVAHLDLSTSQQPSLTEATTNGKQTNVPPRAAFLNISLMAIDDLVIDYGSGTRGGDVIYMSDASQNWQATSFVYDMLEGRPSGAILRYDTGANVLSVLDSTRVAHVRTSNLELTDQNSRLYTTVNTTNGSDEPYLGVGAPRLNEDDVFDDRPLHFPNGLELTDDRQAVLIADTVNKRIIKHYINGPRKGTSDLWAWTPLFPDNIRRGYDKRYETYWVIGCGQDTRGQIDVLQWLQPFPRLRKYILKNVYLFGWIIEAFGNHILGSTSVRDFGYSFKVGHSLCESMCPGMMILQYNKHGDIIRSIYSKEFPNDLVYYSQVNEVIDANNQEHSLYLSSPSYKYVTKLTLPTNSFKIPSNFVR